MRIFPANVAFELYS